MNIKEVRRKLNLSQKEFADKLGVTQTLISKYESGKNNPPLNMLKDIADTFGVSLKYLVIGEGEMFDTELNNTDNAGDGEVPYQSKNKKLSSESEEKYLEIIDKLLKTIDTKDLQQSQLLNIIENLSKTVN